MAGITEYATATGNDYAEHERTYAGVMKMSKIGTAMAVLVVISLAIGGVTGPWWLCGLGVALAIVGGVIGAVSEKGTILPIIGSALLLVALWYIV
ncbi:hypothetical protein GCM10008171_14780 [Methylopila jiangsuensis]|uniref:Cytochrome c oxidase subunit IV bacterial aa3 type domain-containing protein n=1 Tax=Methylopila jiangsuensis TaxID=586230 RepID=A0A9W6N2Q9_9HYPH|nr:aa3-type cytochrome c oxidase subunit IV [Methylopila jiangsuensis]MDR6284259.1 hypothetical protein [Methylopila jiangsuensis]GLK76224.1 hypothetical protein GCM10008171_14780 [Methylopila jiangsuensis]